MSDPLREISEWLSALGVAASDQAGVDDIREPNRRRTMLLGRYVHAMRRIPSGTYLMGGEYGTAKHRVALSTFRMGSTPV
ncbi:MAG: hypothetical protein ACKO5K_06150, partial [Armatimonadota bacterium]